MQLEKIITLANRKVLPRFMALERSLRATGCQLPLWVIPYDEDRFDLPENATWWAMPEVLEWLQAEKTHPMYRKYQCLTTANYQYVDSDVVFLRNPETVLADQTGFITSCGHWRYTGHAITPESESILRSLSTGWQQRVFNAGQFASDQVLYSVAELKQRCHDPRYIETCLRFPSHDQPGLNLLVNLSGAPIRNLTLPPVEMESTWAGDYPDGNYEAFWKSESKKPYLLHWAGCHEDISHPIDRLFLDFLTKEEQVRFREEAALSIQRKRVESQSLRAMLRKVARGARAFFAELGR